MYGVEAGGKGLDTGAHAAPLAGDPGVLHGNRRISWMKTDKSSDSLCFCRADYPGVGPEHSWLKDIGRVECVAANDDEALSAFHRLTGRRHHGSLETSHTAHAEKLALNDARAAHCGELIGAGR